MKLINVKDQLPEVEKKILFIEKWIATWADNKTCYGLHMGHLANNQNKFIAEDEITWHGEQETVSIENVICWTYFDAKQIAQDSEDDYYKDKQ